MASRFLKDRIYKLLFYIAILFSIVILFILLFQIFEKGISYLSIDFLQTSLHVIREKLGLLQLCQGQYYL